MNRIVCTGIALSTLVACVDQGASQDVGSVELASVTYETSWNGEDVRFGANGGWTLVNDLGTTVTIDSGYLVNYQASLVPCVDGETPVADIGGANVGSTTKAAHGDVPDPSASPIPLVEKLLAPGTTELAELTMDADRYCGVHYLIARGNLDTVPLPADVLMIGRTLYLTGTYRRTNDAAPVPFVLDTALAHARLDDLVDIDVVGTGEHAQVAIERDLGRMFDGVEFAGEGEQQRALIVLGNITAHTRITLERY